MEKYTIKNINDGVATTETGKKFIVNADARVGDKIYEYGTRLGLVVAYSCRGTVWPSMIACGSMSPVTGKCHTDDLDMGCREKALMNMALRRHLIKRGFLPRLSFANNMRLYFLDRNKCY